MIRPATQFDIPALLELEEALFGVDAWSAEQLRQELDGPGRRFLVTEEMSGYAVTMTAGDVVDLLRIAVHPQTRREGIASRLLDAALDGTDDASRMLLEVSVTNTDAVAFYVSQQFSVIDVRPHYYRDGSEALVMCRWLPAANRAVPADFPRVRGLHE